MLRVETSTLTEWLRAAEASLSEAGYASSRYDAERLAALGLGVRWGELWARLRDAIDPQMRSTLDALLARRNAGEPLAYITGSVVFCGIELECGHGVLVPRPETETLVDVSLELIADRQAPVVVDIGTGTGAAAIAIARQRPDADVWATERYSDAMRYAERNVRRSGVSVEVVQGDLFDALPDRLEGGCDLVLSNPPYVAYGADVGLDVWAEPCEAVFAGPVGDEVIRPLARGVGGWVSADGAVAIEIGTPQQAGVVRNALQGFEHWGNAFDQADRLRVVWARR